MKIRFFVSASSVVLALWLGATYLRQVPHQQYPVMGKGSVPISVQAAPVMPAAPVIVLDRAEAEPLAESE